jgi:hypothetical protein
MMTNTRSTKSLWARRLKQVAWGGACALVVLAGAQGIARAEDDDESNNSIWNLDTRMYQGFMSTLGLQNGNSDSIEYRERSPLVVPPSRTLPPPEAVTAQPNAAWPVDPDQKRRKDVAAAKRNRKGSNDPDMEGRSLRPSELNPAGTARPGASTRTTNGNGDADGRAILPSQLGYVGGLFSSGFGLGTQKDEVGTFTHEPARNTLVAPPPGYQTPSPAAPYGVTKRIEYDKPMKAEDLAVGRN